MSGADGNAFLLRFLEQYNPGRTIELVLACEFCGIECKHTVWIHVVDVPPLPSGPITVEDSQPPSPPLPSIGDTSGAEAATCSGGDSQPPSQPDANGGGRGGSSASSLSQPVSSCRERSRSRSR